MFIWTPFLIRVKWLTAGGKVGSREKKAKREKAAAGPPLQGVAVWSGQKKKQIKPLVFLYLWQ